MKVASKALFSFLAVITLLIAVPSLQATPLLLDFSTGMAGGGGVITLSGGNASGSGILIDWLVVDGPVVSGGYNVNGLGPTTATSTSSTGILSFSTSANFIKIDGSIPALGIGQTTLFSGTFSSFTIDNFGVIEAVSGFGVDTTSPLLLAAIGVPLNTPFVYSGFTIAARQSGPGYQAFSTDILSSGDVQVPEPASLLLIGIGTMTIVAGSAYSRQGRKGCISL